MSSMRPSVRRSWIENASERERRVSRSSPLRRARYSVCVTSTRLDFATRIEKTSTSSAGSSEPTAIVIMLASYSAASHRVQRRRPRPRRSLSLFPRRETAEVVAQGGSEGSDAESWREKKNKQNGWCVQSTSRAVGGVRGNPQQQPRSVWARDSSSPLARSRRRRGRAGALISSSSSFFEWSHSDRGASRTWLSRR